MQDRNLTDKISFALLVASNGKSDFLAFGECHVQFLLVDTSRDERAKNL